MIHKDVEIIPENPFDEIVLHIEEIPPLDVFYNPKHRAVIKRQRKKRKIDKYPFLTSQMEITNVVWRREFNPSDDLTKISQYSGAYTAATMDKALKVSDLLKEKDQAINLLEAHAQKKQQKIEQLEQQLAVQKQLNDQLNEQLLKKNKGLMSKQFISSKSYPKR